MELRVLRYFLAIAAEETFTAAAHGLCVTQPTLSRQIRELEDELGAPLFIRGKRQVELTEAGHFLRRRAYEILELVDRTSADLAINGQKAVCGDVHIGAAETRGISTLAKAAQKLHGHHPAVHFHLFSGNAQDVAERLDNGLVDFGLFSRPANLEKYDYISLAITDTWGLLTREDHPLAKKTGIVPSDLVGVDLILSRQRLVGNELAGWLGRDLFQLNVVATYNLLYNASLLVRAGLGCALCLDGIIDTSPPCPLRFSPLEPALHSGLDLAWKKGQIMAPACAAFLEYVKNESLPPSGKNMLFPAMQP